jgi:hypothetical protein
MNTLFDFGESIKHLTCVKCGETKPEYLFQIDNQKRSLTKRRSNCKQCGKKASEEVSKISKTAPPKPQSCEFCGRVVVTLRLDHCHKTGKFRAWLCNKCNTGFAQLGDDADALERAAKFIRDREELIKNEI